MHSSLWELSSLELDWCFFRVGLPGLKRHTSTAMVGFRCTLESLEWPSVWRVQMLSGVTGWPQSSLHWRNISRSESCNRPMHHTGAQWIFHLHGERSGWTIWRVNPAKNLMGATASCWLLNGAQATKWCPGILCSGNCQGSNNLVFFPKGFARILPLCSFHTSVLVE